MALATSSASLWLSRGQAEQREHPPSRYQALPRDQADATLRGFAEIAAIQHLHLHPQELERVQQRVRAIRTLGDACDYIAKVAAQLPAAGPGGTARQPASKK